MTSETATAARAIVVPVLALAIGLIAMAAPAGAHFSQGTKVRTILVAQAEDGLVAYLRVPAPLLFTDVIRAAQAAGQPPRSPFLHFQAKPTGPVFFLSLAEIAAQPGAFGDRLADALAWSQNGRPVAAEALSWRITSAAAPEGFATLADARASLARPGAAGDPAFGQAVVEVALALDAPVSDGPLSVRSALPELPLGPGIAIDNHLVDARGDPARSVTRPGQLMEPEVIDGSLLGTVLAFTWQGVLHIVQGLDHVLLVVCFALATGLSTRLLWIVTAFTLGHSVTLITTFLGATPEWPWFVPAVEAAIAATVLYAAWSAWRKEPGSIWVVAAIGLLHGLGFSFVLGEILGREAPNLIEALAAFNVGVEVGQIAILAVTLAIVLAVSRLSAQALPVVRTATLGGIAAVAAYWVVDRSLGIL